MLISTKTLNTTKGEFNLMIIISELTGKEYKTVDECLEAEEIFLKEKEEKEKAEKERKAALDKAYKEAIAACDKYLELAGIKIDEDEDGIQCFKFTVDEDDEDFFKKLVETFF